MVELPRRAASVVAVAVVLSACGAGATTASSGDATAAPAGSPSAAAQERVPDAPIEAFSGDTVTFSEYAGTPVVVNFWASWCPPCIAEMPDLESVHQLVAGEVAFVGVNTQDTPDRAAQLVDETGVTYDLVRDPDGELARAFGVFGMPSTFYVDADGVIVGRHTGLLTRDALLDDLSEHLGVDPESGA